ncbi:MAG: protease, partial [Bacteroidales bacterium]|nr:protease [Bacteroidales bacterium]
MKKLTIILLSFLLVFSSLNAGELTRLLRFPDIHDNKIVFSYAGNLYTVSRDGGVAHRLTNGDGLEIFAHFSPDGSKIAFTGQYDGNTEVYVMPAEGGTPKRLTYTATLSRDDISDRMGPNNIVVGWTPDGKYVLYRSRNITFNDFVGHLYKVPVEGGMSEQMPFSTGSWTSFSPDGKKMAFNRVFREFRTWKYYEGGMADDIRIHDFETHETVNITNHKAQDIFPMWVGNKIYFISDRDRIMNLFVYDTETKSTKKLTNFNEFDIKFPNAGTDAIVFENGGYIYLYDIAKAKSEMVYIEVKEDNFGSRTAYKNAANRINSASMSPDGQRLALSARGDIWSVPADKGITRNLTETSGVHERNAVWSPDGKHIAYVSDKTGETEIFMQEAIGNSEEIQLTKDADTYKYSLNWSPDSKKILFNDKMQRLQYVDINSKKIVEVVKSPSNEINYFNWSPDSKWVAYSVSDTTKVSKIYLYNVDNKKTHKISSDWYDSYNPVFSDCGKYLFFISNRDFNPIYSSTEWNHAYRDMSKIYFVTLNANDLSPLAPVNHESDYVDDKKSDKKDKEQTEKTPNVKIDLENIENRIVALPISAGNYWGMQVFNNKVYYGYSKINQAASLKVFDFVKNEEKDLGAYANFQISTDRKKMLIRQGNNFHVIDLPVMPIKLEKTVNTLNMKVWVDLQAEWMQIFTESWRQMRDFFYAPNMHGVDWDAIREKYEPLVQFVNDRNDLNYIIGELIGELNAGHAYVNGGERKEVQRINMGLLGAEISKNQTGYFKIDKILKGENWLSNSVSPLTGPGMQIEEGDFIVSINGKSLKDEDDIYKLLLGKANTKIEIGISSKANEKDVRKYIIQPISSEAQLYYYNWVQNNIDYVNEKTNGLVGYIHVPDMSVVGLNEFMKHFYPQLSKKALIIDDRGNGGGNVSPMLIERLRREVSMMAVGRNNERPYTKPGEMINGPKVLLINQYSASDGDLFPYQFRKHKLGKIIGVRSWGGVVGIRGTLPFIDGASLNRPEFAHFSADGDGWIIEGYGVDPDIVVDNDTYEEFMGKDAQLDKAIEVILQELENFDGKLPEIPE